MDREEALSILFNQVSSRFSELNFINEKKFMLSHKFLEIHCIELIGKGQDSNVTRLANAMHLTRGAVSKTTKRLIQHGEIEAYQRPENKKEIYYRLTDSGKALFDCHEDMHRKRIGRGRAYFMALTQEEKDSLAGILAKIDARLAEELKLLQAVHKGDDDDADTDQ